MPQLALALTDSELDAILAAAKPLPVQRRDAFLNAVVTELHGRELGPGLVHRVCAKTQRAFFEPPQLAAGAPGRGAKYR